MYAITGITGQVGGALARALLDAGQPVRAVVRDSVKGEAWATKGCEVAIAEMEDDAALADAFRGAEGVFILPPNAFDPKPGFPEARAVIAAVKQALEASRPDRVVCLSTIGAQAQQPNLLTQRTLMEEALARLTMPICFLRPAWFMENFAWDVASAKSEGILASFLQPLDKSIPMIATADIGYFAAGLLQERWQGRRVVEIESQRRYSPNDVAAAFATVLERPVRAQAVPRESWASLFKSQGMNDPVPRIQMLDGFNEGWIDFEGNPLSIAKGTKDLEAVLCELISPRR